MHFGGISTLQLFTWAGLTDLSNTLTYTFVWNNLYCKILNVQKYQKVHRSSTKMYFSVSFPWSILFVFPGSKVYCRNVESSIEKRYSYLKTYLLHTCVVRCSQLALMKSNILQRSNKLDFPLLDMVFHRKLHSLCPMG